MNENKFLNKYFCKHCNENWSNTWSCTCNDKCPICGREIEPYQVIDVIDPEENKWHRIQMHCANMSREALAIQQDEFATWGPPWSPVADYDKTNTDYSDITLDGFYVEEMGL